MHLNKAVSVGFIYVFGGLGVGILGLNFDKMLIMSVEIMQINSVSLGWEVVLDMYSVLFGSTVMLISGGVFNYSDWYMMGEEKKNGFSLIVSMFVGSMGFLIFIPNLIGLMVGWDGLGVTSFLLIIYYQNHYSVKCGLLTFLTNRLGDMFLLVSMVVICHEGSSNLMLWENELFFIIMFILLASMTKGAQVPFSSWLPAAMAAPTPVSALVHSSTLVTAGVFLLIRFSHVVEENILLMNFLYFVGMLTMILSGLSALTEMDLKKVIAYLALSQLGLMFVCLSLGMAKVTFFHLLSHASFKATLFLCAGVLIHLNNNCQDLRYLSSNWVSAPMTIMCMNACNLSLCGFPFLAGFYSKDMILESGMFVGGGSIHFIFFFHFGNFDCSMLFSNLVCNSSVMKLSISGSGEKITFMFPIMMLSSWAVTMGWVFISSMEWIFNPFLVNSADVVFISVMLVLGVMLGSMSKKMNNFSSKILQWLSGMWGLIILNKFISEKSMSKMDGIFTEIESGWVENSVGSSMSWEWILGLIQKSQDSGLMPQILVIMMVMVGSYMVV
uniref:NADH:ubiquinone reductase (H(+)-translocating) n=1 Tax=Siphonodentalium lobatum TaxID=203167 RepID=Q6VEH9_9MOLL|nr:NADH dehydrogenase subunit 5 [Siphonodentalium lobatum]AAP91669.1 NADH dehydrogenase subunit 5 [Siphonodentalium lobatum]